ncbi:MAG: hypothetical protein KBH07_08885 [Flavobacteriales bacterium]|nr:hypothetical protein [Flavobacteriales bacterium]MBP9080336.1 hypothetical protein [Flavobacteriales bacterium]
MRLFANHRFLLLLPAWGCILQAWAGGPVTWSFSSVPGGGDTLQVRLTATCEPGWHIYALELPSDQGPLPSEVEWTPTPAYRLLGATTEPKPIEKDDPNFGVAVRYHPGVVSFIQRVVRNTERPFAITGAVAYMACNDKTCLPPRRVPFAVNVPSTIEQL